MSRIVFFETEEWEKEVLSNGLSGQDVSFISEPLSNTLELTPDILSAEIISVFIYSKITKEIIEKFPHLKLITTRSTGYDHIDVAAAKEKGIEVTNVPTYGIHTVAEHTWGLILALVRKLPESIERAKKGNFEVIGLSGMELYGKTLGIVGVGNIGSVVAHIGLAFGMKVVAYNRTVKEDLQKEGVEFKALEDVLSGSDVLSFHLPLTAETTHILNMNNISLLKKGAYLVNCARGALIETQALLEALEKGIVKGIGLDVLEEECDMREERELLSSKFMKTCDLKTALLDHELLMRDDVIITPHNAFHSDESVKAILHSTIDTIQQFEAGKSTNLVS